MACLGILCTGRRVARFALPGTACQVARIALPVLVRCL